MANTQPLSTELVLPHRPLWPDLLHAARYYLSRPRTLIVLAIAAIAAGLAFNWSWLVAAGVAPLLLTLLPCAAMCALHLCMKPGDKDQCKNDSVREQPHLSPTAPLQQTNREERS